MPGKVLTEEGLKKDLRYTLEGIDCHQVLESICPPMFGLKVLEPGCGSGKLGLWYYLRGAEVTLLDIDPAAIAYARALFQQLCDIDIKALRQYVQQPVMEFIPPRFVVGNIHSMTKIFGGEAFDLVYNEGCSHHWQDWRRQHSIGEMVRVTKPGGSVCIIGSNARCPATMKMAETTRHTYPGMPPHQLPFRPEELQDRLLRAGLCDVHVEPVNGTWEESLLLAGWGRRPVHV